MKKITLLKTAFLLFLCMCTSLFCKKEQAEPDTGKVPQTITPRIIKVLPHDSNSFTQGLFLHNGKLYESTGLYNESTMRITDTSSGTVILSHPLPPVLFGEGCALLDNRIFQITWQEQQCLVYSPENLLCIDTISYSGEGWGLTTYRSVFFMSNGTDTLYQRNASFHLIGKLPVTLNGKPLTSLNELEFAEGKIYANVWFSDYIFEIDPASGKVTRIIDCSSIVAEEKPSSDQAVLNGIAYDENSKTFFITGKKWKKMFVVKF